MDRVKSGMRVLAVAGLGVLLAAVAVTLGLVGVHDGAQLTAQAAQLQAPDLILVLAEFAGAVVAGWLALGVLLTVAAHVCGLRLPVNLLPKALRPLLSAALGASVVVGAAAVPASAAPTSAPGISANVTAPGPGASAPDPGWVPSTTTPSAPTSSTPSAPTTPAPTAPKTSAAAPTPSSHPSTSSPTGRPTPQPVHREQSPKASQPASARTVTVHRGDTLWAIAEHQLQTEGIAHPSDRQVAAQWPKWHAANRTVIGDDPDLLSPGDVLRPPA